MKAPKQPAPVIPDPYSTAAAQTASNKETAITQSNLNMIDQYTPEGSLTYNPTGGLWNDGTPRMAVTQRLSPENEALRRQENEFDRKFNQIGLNQTDKVGEILGKPLDLSNEATEARLMELGSKRLDPRFAEESQKLEQDLMNRGIRPGSAAYDTMRRQFTEGKNDAYNQLLLGGRSQAVQEALTERNQPLNEITALLNGQQISLPQYQQTPQTNLAGTDIGGMIYDSANMANQSAQARYNAKNQNYQAGMGGLFGLGSSLLGGGARLFAGR
jgi:hypothetical protein